jgi:glyoxylase-like metal-dependent hydrolase (beta-lactamase superfamily II)
MGAVRRLIGWLLVSALVLCGCVVVLGAWTFSGMGRIEPGRVLPGNATVVKDGYVSAYVIEIDLDSVALVDTGNDAEGKAILAELRRKGLGPEAVEVILLTHGHPDHTAACHLFPNAIVYADGDELPLLTGRVGSSGPLTQLFGAMPSTCSSVRPVKDGDEVPLGTRLARVFALPGHTSGSAAWLVDGVLYLGDAADASSGGRMLGAKWLFTDNPARARRSLISLADRVADLDVRMLAFSHSGVLVGTRALAEYADGNRGW